MKTKQFNTYFTEIGPKFAITIQASSLKDIWKTVTVLEQKVH